MLFQMHFQIFLELGYILQTCDCDITIRMYSSERSNHAVHRLIGQPDGTLKFFVRDELSQPAMSSKM